MAPIDDALREQLMQRIDTMAESGLRTLTLAYRDIPKLKKWKEPPEEELTLIGIVGIMVRISCSLMFPFPLSPGMLPPQ